MHFGLRVKDVLKAAGMTQKKLAKRLGVTEPRISHIIKSEVPPITVGATDAIARALGVTINELLGEDVPMPDNYIGEIPDDAMPQRTVSECLGGDFSIKVTDNSMAGPYEGVPRGANAVIKRFTGPIKDAVGRMCCIRSKATGAHCLRLLEADFDSYLLAPWNADYKKTSFDPESMEIIGYCVAFYMEVDRP